MDSFCREQPSLLPPDLKQGEPKGCHWKVIASLWQVLAQEFLTCIHLFFVTVHPRPSCILCDILSMKHEKLFRVGDAKSTIIKQVVKEVCNHHVAPSPLIGSCSTRRNYEGWFIFLSRWGGYSWSKIHRNFVALGKPGEYNNLLNIHMMPRRGPFILPLSVNNCFAKSALFSPF